MTAPAHVLLVEDEEAHAELARAAFERAPEFRLTVAASVGQARAALAASPPQLVIADLQLPDGRGIELLPADPGRASYPVLITTSHGDESVAVEAMKAGALDYFVKSAEALAELPRFAARALREWTLVLERRRAEEQLRERERQLQHAQRLEALGRLATGVAHDFNNVLMGIMGCAQLALSRLPPDAPARRYLEELDRAARGGAAIAKSMLTFGRREASEVALVGLDDAIRGAEQLVRALAGDEVRLHLDLGCPGARVSCPDGELQQLVLNLAINARDAMPRGGTLTISTRPERGDAAGAAGAWALLTVADTGVGMDPATLQRAFEPFFTTKPAGKGTGLGLAMVYGAVRAAGGAVHVESQPGAGTRFTLRLPIAAPPKAEPREAAAAVQPPLRLATPPTTVLLLEDDPRVAMLARHWLEELGHRVLEAHDAGQARAQWARAGASIGLLLSDVALPNESGPELAAQLKAQRPDLPVLFMSAHAAVALAREQHLPEGAALLAKPFTREQLAAQLSRVLAPSAAPSLKPRVLVVEDNAAARLATVELLGEEGLEVLGVASAAEAATQWEASDGAFDVLICDLTLPDEAGDVLAARLRAARPALPVVFVSGRDPMDPEVRRLVEAPGTHFVGKPVDFASLSRLVRELSAPRG